MKPFGVQVGAWAGIAAAKRCMLPWEYGPFKAAEAFFPVNSRGVGMREKKGQAGRGSSMLLSWKSAPASEAGLNGTGGGQGKTQKRPMESERWEVFGVLCRAAASALPRK